ncbi:MAG: hypothetical protein Solumvirus1_40 [Solumvirus sp.]|uniref:Uncharacterized protein n=1 Tax=Solumvirus sp. TaxID=2487773 RepID=A0A3G5AG24_9VIRU|nr:MAG: hypothetical protein Solumvirus1_40 [Solumvirus sp.]
MNPFVREQKQVLVLSDTSHNPFQNFPNANNQNTMILNTSRNNSLDLTTMNTQGVTIIDPRKRVIKVKKGHIQVNTSFIYGLIFGILTGCVISNVLYGIAISLLMCIAINIPLPYSIAEYTGCETPHAFVGTYMSKSISYAFHFLLTKRNEYLAGLNNKQKVKNGDKPNPEEVTRGDNAALK